MITCILQTFGQQNLSVTLNFLNRLFSFLLNCWVQSISLHFLLWLCRPGLLGTWQLTSFSLKMLKINVIRLLVSNKMRILRRNSNIFRSNYFSIRHRILKISWTDQFLRFLIKERHAINCVPSLLFILQFYFSCLTKC